MNASAACPWGASGIDESREPPPGQPMRSSVNPELIGFSPLRLVKHILKLAKTLGIVAINRFDTVCMQQKFLLSQETLARILMGQCQPLSIATTCFFAAEVLCCCLMRLSDPQNMRLGADSAQLKGRKGGKTSE